MNNGSTAVISIFVIPEASLSALADIGSAENDHFL